jgi:2-phosphosulfolactate phosphatase
VWVPDGGDLAYPVRRQNGFDLRFEWGSDGLRQLGPAAGAVVIVDVLRFTTAVSVAVGRGARVLPYPWAGGDAETYAAQHNAWLAGRRENGEWSLSPTGLARLPAGSRLVLPSPDGSALAFGARERAPAARVLAGCLRNASAVASTASAVLPWGGSVVVIGAGERWTGQPGHLRVAVEDLLGAGAILRALRVVAGVAVERVSPEARAAMAAFDDARDDLRGSLLACESGRELVGRGWRDDVEAAAVVDAEAVAQVLDGAAFVGVTPSPIRHLR